MMANTAATIPVHQLELASEDSIDCLESQSSLDISASEAPSLTASPNGSSASKDLGDYSGNNSDQETYITTIELFGNKSLGESLKIHKSALERARDEALLAAEPRTSRNSRSRISSPSSSPDEGIAPEYERKASKKTAAKSLFPEGDHAPLEQTLKVHKSRLQLDKEAAEVQQLPRTTRQASVSDHAPLEATLKVHKSRLELDKEQALKEGQQPRRVLKQATDEHAPLEQTLKVHKSRLQLDKEAALAVQAPRRIAKPEVEVAPFELGAPHKSLVARHKEAAAASAAGGSAASSTSGQMTGRRSRLQMEREALARMEAVKKAAEAAALAVEQEQAKEEAVEEETIDIAPQVDVEQVEEKEAAPVDAEQSDSESI